MSESKALSESSVKSPDSYLRAGSLSSQTSHSGYSCVSCLAALGGSIIPLNCACETLIVRTGVIVGVRMLCSALLVAHPSFVPPMSAGRIRKLWEQAELNAEAAAAQSENESRLVKKNFMRRGLSAKQARVICFTSFTCDSCVHLSGCSGKEICCCFESKAGEYGA